MRVLLAGLCTVDLVQRVTELPEPGEKTQSVSVDVAAGGPAANAAVAVAALGGHATLLTVVGGHPLATLAAADLAAHGVIVQDALPAHTDPPAVSAVAVRERDGERTVVSHNAAAVGSPAVPATLPAADAVLVDGHHPSLARAAARHARELGVPLVVDAGSWKPVLADVLPLADVVAASAHFRVPEDGGAALADVPVVVTTAGAQPVRWRTRTGSGEVAVPRVTALDTLGAGDVWHGALALYAATEGLTGDTGVVGAIGFANRVAAERVRHPGPRRWCGPVRALAETLRS